MGDRSRGVGRIDCPVLRGHPNFAAVEDETRTTAIARIARSHRRSEFLSALTHLDRCPMSYCLNPTCIQPHNPDTIPQCQTCGTTLRLQDRYLPLRLLGQGGFGRTFLAVDIADPLKPRYVIKQSLPPLGDRGDQAAVRFRQEAAGLEQLGSHPQIPRLIAHLEQEGRSYLVQEWIDGPNLVEELATQGAWDEAQIRQLLADVLPVLQFMHDRHIIHRDIKPANIIRRRRDQQLVVVDLGAATSATGMDLGQTGTVIGSAEFTAPEQTRGKAIFASDLYSLGVTCVHLLTDLPPFDLFDSSDDRWVWREYLVQPVSPTLGAMLDRLLDRATKRRYVSATAVLRDLVALASLPASSPVRLPLALGTRTGSARSGVDPARDAAALECAGDRQSGRSGRRSPQKPRPLGLAQGSQALLMVMPLIVGIVVGVSWLGGQARSLPPTGDSPAALFHTHAPPP